MGRPAAWQFEWNSDQRAVTALAGVVAAGVGLAIVRQSRLTDLFLFATLGLAMFGLANANRYYSLLAWIVLSGPLVPLIRYPSATNPILTFDRGMLLALVPAVVIARSPIHVGRPTRYVLWAAAIFVA